MAIDIDFVSRTIADCAQTHIMPRFRALAAHEIQTKTGPDDLVTQADLDMEQALGAALLDAYPDTKMLGEEGMAAGRATLALLAEPDARIWVVDPVDGTYNFVHGKERFGVLVALVQGGQTLAGWIYDVPRRAMTVARRGQGVYRDGARLGLSSVETVAESNAGICLNYFPAPVRQGIREKLGAMRGHSCGHCAAHEYLDFLEGKIDFALHYRANPWDHLAGILAVEELGGVVRTWDGGRYRPAAPESLLIAATEPLWKDVQTRILAGLERKN